MATHAESMSGGLKWEQLQLIYSPDFNLSQLSEEQRKIVGEHSLNSQFSIAILITLHYLTFGIFTVIYFGLKFSRLPAIRNNDLTAGKAIGFSFIPLFNAYWLFRFWFNLIERINFQFRLMGQRRAISTGLTSVAVITGVIPYINLLISYLILFPILIGQIQNAINKLAVAKCATPTWEPLSSDQERVIYSSSFDISQLTEEQRKGFSKHSFVSVFPTVAVVVLHFLTFGMFTHIYFALKHSKPPLIKKDDFGWAKAIDFFSIPFFNFYWIFKFWLRLVDRVNLQFKLRSQGLPISRSLTMFAVVVWEITTVVGIIIAIVSIPELIANSAFSPDYQTTPGIPTLSDVFKLAISPYKSMFQSYWHWFINPKNQYYVPAFVLMSIVVWQIQNATNNLARINLLNQHMDKV